MLTNITRIAVSELKTLQRQKVLLLILAVFLGMTLFSTYIGWSTRQTINEIYKASVQALVNKGVLQYPVNPFAASPALTVLKNMIIYVLLIGSLLAIVVGHTAFIRERRAGVGKIIFSRPINRYAFLMGKMAGILLVLTMVTVAALLISVVSVSLISGRMLTAPEIGRLILYYGLSLLYMTIFGLIGLYFAIRAKNESFALLGPVTIWLLISFVLPQLTSALDPAALLNPTSIQTDFPQSSFFLSVRTFIEPFSISEHYKTIGRTLLEYGTGGLPAGACILALAGIFGACMWAMKKFDICEETINE